MNTLKTKCNVHVRIARILLFILNVLDVLPEKPLKRMLMLMGHDVIIAL